MDLGCVADRDIQLSSPSLSGSGGCASLLSAQSSSRTGLQALLPFHFPIVVI